MKMERGRFSSGSLKRTLIFLFLLASPLISMGQADEGCGGQDPYDIACPLDTWVFLLVIVACLFAVIYLQRKGKYAGEYDNVISSNEN
jgi:hypothetical protein